MTSSTCSSSDCRMMTRELTAFPLSPAPARWFAFRSTNSNHHDGEQQKMDDEEAGSDRRFNDDSACGDQHDVSGNHEPALPRRRWSPPPAIAFRGEPIARFFGHGAPHGRIIGGDRRMVHCISGAHIRFRKYSRQPDGRAGWPPARASSGCVGVSIVYRAKTSATESALSSLATRSMESPALA